ncbi:VOC family protein [Aliiroseovarius sp. 2305UL8-7]|uniref:VOC family protein n=1 Tax=Aliiroseovarius conchicola TaxID=3121637 RepID=UPI003527D1FB
MTTQPIVVWAEIPVSDIRKATAFYNAAFDWSMEVDTTSGPEPMALLGGRMDTVGGNLYEGDVAEDGRGPRVHIAIDIKLEDAAKRWENAGGKVITEPVEIPPGRFVFATDPDGNTLGLFEPKG